MKKSVLFCAVVLAVSMVFAFSCKKKSSAGSTKGGNSVTISLLTDQAGIDDKSFNASAWKGIEKFYNKSGKGYGYLVAGTEDQYVPNLTQATDEGNSLIVCCGFTWADALAKVAKDNPNQKYMLVDVAGIGLPNVVEAVFSEEMGSYLVGVIAAEQAKAENVSNPKFGFIGGIPSSTITKFEVGFVQGVRSVFPNAQIFDYYANNFGAPELAKAQSKTWFDQGVYCVFSAAGATGNGVIAQAKEYRSAGKNVWAIGVDCDQHEDGIFNASGDSAVLTSMLKNVDVAVYSVLTNIKNNAFKAGMAEFDLKSGGVGYSTRNNKIAKSALDKAEQASKDIISGKISVEKTYKGAKAKGLVPDNLKAIDD